MLQPDLVLVPQSGMNAARFALLTLTSQTLAWQQHTFLGGDSNHSFQPAFLSNTGCFPWVFDGSGKEGSLKRMVKVPLEPCFFAKMKRTQTQRTMKLMPANSLPWCCLKPAAQLQEKDTSLCRSHFVS